MSNQVNPINWEELTTKHKNYDGTIRNFCKENNITERQFYYYRKKYKHHNKPTFHPIILNKTNDKVLNTNASELNNANNIIIEIGKSKLHIPSNNTAIISNIIKELIKSC